jgi:DNA modification methylase
MSDWKNQLYYGDNLDVLRRYVKDESVDLIYLDPPFNSRQEYAVLFAEKDGSKSSSQFHAFEDTWEWNVEAARAYEQIVEQGGRVADAMRAFRTFLGGTDMLAYLAMMAPRLVQLRRVLKETGSIYLHCDPTASHYLKILMDAVFGPQFFRNEIVWERTTGRKSGRQYGRVHDTLLFFSKGEKTTWNPPVVPQSEDSARGHDILRDAGGRYRLSDLTGAGQGPAREFDGMAIDPPAGRHWAYDQAGLNRLWDEGRISLSRGGKPRLKTYVKNLTGVAVRDVWTDIGPLNSAAAERLGYPTQKPEALLERIIRASSKTDDLVLDPFCGCGTTVQVAQRLKRRWIGIDITHLAIGLIKKRLSDSFGLAVKESYSVTGEPTDYAGAATLAAEDKYQFQWWALGQVGARPAEQKKGADRGIDGRLYFHDDEGGQSKQIIFSVKAGGVTVSQIRDLVGVLAREKAQIGVFLCFEEPTRAMLREAAEAGLYKSPDRTTYPKLQILTIQQILDGAQPAYPRFALSVTYKKAPKARASTRQRNLSLFSNPGD